MSTSVIPAPSGGGTITVDTALDTTSTRPVQNKAIATAVNNLNNNKQDTLVSGTSIKTINSQSLLGSGNIDISSGGTITIDGELSDTSENPVQNKVVKDAIDAKYTKPSTGIPASDLASGVIPNTFSNIVVGSTTIAADSKTDTLTLVAGTNVTLIPDATNDKIAIAASGGGGSRTYTKPWYINTSGTVVECDSIQAAINGCPVHGTVHIPWYGTTYTISSQLTINKPLTLTSDYYGYEAGERVTVGSTTQATDIPLLSYNGTEYAINIMSVGVTINNISLHTKGGGILIGPNPGQTAPYSRYDRFNNIFIRRIYDSNNNSDNNTNTGIVMQDTFKTVFENCVVFDFNLGFYIAKGTSTTMINCWAREYKLYGYNLSEMTYTSLINCAADTSPTSEDEGQIAYYIADSYALSLVSCGAEHSGSYLISINNVHGITCEMHLIGSNEAWGHAPISISESSATFIGCQNSCLSSYPIVMDENSNVSVIGCFGMNSAWINGDVRTWGTAIWSYPSS